MNELKMASLEQGSAGLENPSWAFHIALAAAQPYFAIKISLIPAVVVADSKLVRSPQQGLSSSPFAPCIALLYNFFYP